MLNHQGLCRYPSQVQIIWLTSMEKDQVRPQSRDAPTGRAYVDPCHERCCGTAVTPSGAGDVLAIGRGYLDDAILYADDGIEHIPPDAQEEGHSKEDNWD